MTKNKILFGVLLFVCQTMLAGPRYEHDYHSGGGTIIILFILLGLMYLFRKK